MKLLSNILLAGAVLAVVAPTAAEACGSCSSHYEAGHWENRTQRVRVPGQWTFELQNVTTPGRYEVTYQTVRRAGFWKNVNQQVWVPGQWVRTRRHRRNHIRFGSQRGVTINIGAPARRQRWVPGHYKTVCKRVWVPGCVERKPVRKWIPGCTTQKRVRVWKPACYENRTVRVWVPARTTTICNVLD